jgi:hypothetical protein
MGSPTHYAYCEKEMLGWIRETMAIQESTPRGGMFFAFGSTVIGNGTSTCSDPCTPCGDYSTNQPINQEVGVPPPPSFPHTMLNVKRLKANMRLTFIKKLFTNREIGTNM